MELYNNVEFRRNMLYFFFFKCCFPGDFPRNLETYAALCGAAFSNATSSQPSSFSISWACPEKQHNQLYLWCCKKDDIIKIKGNVRQFHSLTCLDEELIIVISFSRWSDTIKSITLYSGGQVIESLIYRSWIYIESKW